jgi:HD-like signal output (HDOD) protein
MVDSPIRNYISKMPSFSATVTKVLQICNRPDTSAIDLNRVISLDPVLTGSVLKLVNSAYYSLGKEVSSVTHAIILLGINTVKNLALSIAVIQSFGGGHPRSGLSLDDFWVHSLGAGVISRSLAQLHGHPRETLEDYFVAGLLHDLGKIPLNHCFPVQYPAALEAARRERVSLSEAERDVLGMDHGAVGALIAEKWHLHRDLSAVLQHHHHPERGGIENPSFVMIAALGNLCAGLWQIGSAGESFLDAALAERLRERLVLAPARIAAVREKVLEDIDKALIFLQVVP